jgi:uncharacterized RDD family membrane protein YckC
MTDAPVTAGLARRSLAFLVDYLVIAVWLVVLVGIALGLRAVAPDLTDAVFGDPLSAESAGFVLLTLPVILYFAISEAAPRGATIGKRRMSIRVVTQAGAPVSLPRSFARTILKLLPWELTHAIVWRFAVPGSAPELLLDGGLVLVWILILANVAAALIDAERRTLYDRLSATRVATDSRFPA